MRVLLLSNRSWLTREVFESKTDLLWAVRMPLGQLKEPKQLLHLSQQIVVDHVSLVFFHLWRAVIDCLEELVPKLWDHVQLLQHGDHVAHAAKVDYAAMLVNATLGRR